MGSFGERLQREREMRGVTLEEIAHATKIGTRALRALEEEEFGKLPGGIFNKGFVRAYARYLGINEEQAVADYLTAMGEDASLSDEATLQRLEPALRAEKERLTSGNESDRPYRLAPVLVIIVIAVCTALGWNFYSRHKLRIRAQHSSSPLAETNSTPYSAPKPAINAAQADAAVTSPTPAAAPSSDNSSTAPTAVTDVKPALASQSATAANGSKMAEELLVFVRARQKSWLSIQADGKSVMKDVLQAGGETSVHAKNQVVLTAGNAGGVEVSLNGKVLPPIGSADEVRTVVINAAGVRPRRPKPEAPKAEAPEPED